MESNSSRTKVQALMGMALRGRWSKKERKEDREGERPPSSIILLIREIRFGESIRPKIKSSLFHTDRDGSWRKSLLRSPNLSASPAALSSTSRMAQSCHH